MSKQLALIVDHTAYGNVCAHHKTEDDSTVVG